MNQRKHSWYKTESILEKLHKIRLNGNSLKIPGHKLEFDLTGFFKKTDFYIYIYM